LLPLRKAALYLAASGAGRTPLSGTTQDRAIAMVTAIKNADPFLSNLASAPHDVDSIETLLFVKERLETIYEIR
jgi:hypothetical protein